MEKQSKDKTILILIVDDEHQITEILEKKLREFGYKTMTSNNLRDAIEIVKTLEIDIVLTDIEMPGGNGLQLLDEIRRYDPVKPLVVLMTGAHSLSLDLAKKRGAFTLIHKPFGPKILLETLEICEKKLSELESGSDRPPLLH